MIFPLNSPTDTIVVQQVDIPEIPSNFDAAFTSVMAGITSERSAQLPNQNENPCDDIIVPDSGTNMSISFKDDNLTYSQSHVAGMNVDTFPLEDSEEENISPNISSSEPDNQIVLQKSFKKHASTEMKFRCFEVNWCKVSDTIIQRLNTLQEFKNNNPKKTVPTSIRFAKTDLSALVNVIVDQLRIIDTQIKAETMECVAKMIFTKFPCLDFEDDDGFGGGNGYIALKYKMINRNTYLNRFRDHNVPNASSTQTRKSRHVKACTIKEYWKRSSKDCDPAIISKLLRNEPDILTTELLKESQAYIRYRLDEKKQLALIISDFPVLRRRKLILYHFEQCTGTEATCLEYYFQSKRKKLISFSKTRPQATMHLTDTCTDAEIFKFICNLVGDNWSELICNKEAIRFPLRFTQFLTKLFLRRLEPE